MRTSSLSFLQRCALFLKETENDSVGKVALYWARQAIIQFEKHCTMRRPQCTVRYSLSIRLSASSHLRAYPYLGHTVVGCHNGSLPPEKDCLRTSIEVCSLSFSHDQVMRGPRDSVQHLRATFLNCDSTTIGKLYSTWHDSPLCFPLRCPDTRPRDIAWACCIPHGDTDHQPCACPLMGVSLASSETAPPCGGLWNGDKGGKDAYLDVAAAADTLARPHWRSGGSAARS